MGRFTLIAVVLITAGCVANGPAGAAGPSSNATASAVRSTTRSSTSSGATELAGDLPAMNSHANAIGDVQQAGGFVHVADGSFRQDPQAAMTQDPSTHLWRTSATPQLLGTGEPTRGRITYSWQLQRWLPVSWNQVSPDRLTYAYATGVYPDSTSGQPGEGFPSSVEVHVVDPRSGTDRVVFRADTPPFWYTVLSFPGPVIYLSQECPSGCGPESLKLWRLDVASGELSKISDRQGFVWVIDRGFGWVVTYGQDSTSDQLFRIDLATGLETSWLTSAGLQLVGVDGDGVPLLDVRDFRWVRPD